MDVHKTIANYKNTLVRFFEGKTVLQLLIRISMLILKKWPVKLFLSFEYDEKLQVWGRFNALMLFGLQAIASDLKIPKDIIHGTLLFKQ